MQGDLGLIPDLGARIPCMLHGAAKKNKDPLGKYQGHDRHIPSLVEDCQTWTLL